MIAAPLSAQDAPPRPDALAAQLPERAPTTTLVLSIVAQTGEAVEAGDGPDGPRRIVPIIGGTFSGPGLSGVVLPGGADRQRRRADGVRELDAVYELRADDGTVLMVHNRVLVDDQVQPQRYARSVVTVAAPAGRHAWLNRKLLVGTLTSLRPHRPYVLIRIYQVD